MVYERAVSGGACLAFEASTPIVNGSIVARTDKVVNKSAQRFNFGRMLLPRDVGSGGANVELGRHVDMHRNDNGQFDATDNWDQVTDLIQSNDVTQFKTYTFRGVVGEFDSGTVGDIDYLVSIDNFRLRAFFVEDPAWDLSDAIGPYGTQGIQLTDAGTAEPPGVLGVLPRFVKVAPVEALTGLEAPAGDNFGFGLAAAGSRWWDHTNIFDDPEAEGGGFAGSGVGGKRFRIEFADQSQGFEVMTSGSITAAGYLMFDEAGGGADWQANVCGSPPCLVFPGFDVAGTETPSLDSGGGAMGRFMFQYLGDGYVYTNNPATPQNAGFGGGSVAGDPWELYSPPFNGTPLEHSIPDLPVDLHMIWDHLAGREGQMKLVVNYQDAYENRIGTVVKTYAVDASPPRIDDIQLKGDFFNYPKLVAGNIQNWTSNTAVVLEVDGQETSAVFREFIPGNNFNIPSTDITVSDAPRGRDGLRGPGRGSVPGPVAL